MAIVLVNFAPRVANFAPHPSLGTKKDGHTARLWVFVSLSEQLESSLGADNDRVAFGLVGYAGLYHRKM